MKIALVKVRDGLHFPKCSWMNVVSGTLDEKLEKSFRYFNGMVFVGSMGILVRKICGYLESKYIDPCVVVLDEKLKYCIPVLSSHLGGGMDLCGALQSEFGCKPVYTTATDVNGLTGVDLFAKKNNMLPEGKTEIRNLNAKLVEKGFIKASNFPRDLVLPRGYVVSEDDADIGFESGGMHLNLIGKNLVLGIGFHTDLTPEELYEEFEDAIPPDMRRRILVMASHEKKWSTQAFHRFAKIANIDHTAGYCGRELQDAIEELGIDCHNSVREHMGVSHVSKPSAYLASFGGTEIMTVKGNNSKFSVYEIERDFWNRYQNYYEKVPEVIL